jgi:hypothetical protein
MVTTTSIREQDEVDRDDPHAWRSGRSSSIAAKHDPSQPRPSLA